MEGKFKWLADEAVKKDTDGGSVFEHVIEPPVDDQGREEKFEEETAKAVESAQTLQHAVYGLFEHIDDPKIKVTLIEELVGVIEEIGAEQGHLTKSLEHVYENGKAPSINPLYHKARELIDTYGYESVRETALNYKLAANADWNTPKDSIQYN